MAKAKDKELANADDTALEDFGAFANEGDTGFEGTDSSTFKTPFLKILQALSPELKKSDPKYIEGAEQGDLVNSATQEIYKDLEAVVLKIEHSLVVWKPDRGGFVGRYPLAMEDKVVAHKDGLEKFDADGNEVMDAIEFFLMNVNDPADIMILSMSTSSIKHAKAWATRLRMLKVNGKPVRVSWAGVWKIGTVEEKNDKGAWFTVGNTPTFQRVITSGEKEMYVDPAREMLSTASVDYNATLDNAEGADETGAADTEGEF